MKRNRFTSTIIFQSVLVLFFMATSGCDALRSSMLPSSEGNARTNQAGTANGSEDSSDRESTSRVQLKPDKNVAETAKEAQLTEEELKELNDKWNSRMAEVQKALNEGDSESARESFARLEEVGIALGESIGDHYFVALLEINAAISLAMGELAEALELYEQAFAIALECELDALPLAILGSELGHCYRLNGKFQEAVEVLEVALKDLEAFDDDVNRQMSAVGDLYEAYVKLQNPEKTIETLERGLAILLPMVDTEHNRVAYLSGLAAELCQLIGDQDRFQEFAELCQSLNKDYQLSDEIRTGLVNAKIIDISPHSLSESSSPIVGNRLPQHQPLDDQDQLTIAQAEFQSAQQRFEIAERNWNAEQTRLKTMQKLANDRAGRMGALNMGPAHFMFDLDPDLYIQREYLNAQTDLERAQRQLELLR